MKLDDLSNLELWQRYSTQKNKDIRNLLILRYIDVVKKIVYMILPTYSRYTEYEELISYGILGLINAVERFDIKRDVKFETYASIRIRGEIIDQIRKQDWAPSNVRSNIKKIEIAHKTLQEELQREPTESELSEHLGISVDVIRKNLEDYHVFNILYLDEMFSENTNCDIDSGESYVGYDIEQNELKDELISFIDSLKDKEKLVISMYYYEEMTLKEIALVLGVTESRVCQIHSKAISRLREKLESKI